MCATFHSRIYTALPYTEHFAGPSMSVGFLHKLKVFILFGSLSPELPYHIHPASVKLLYRARSSSKICSNFHSRNCTALQYTEQFAVQSCSEGCLHLFKVYIFWFSFLLTTSSYSPCFGENIVPR